MNYNNIDKTPSEHELPTKVVAGNVKVKDKSAGKKIAEELVNDNLTSVKSYILSDVIIPKLKEGIYDAIVGAIGMLLGIDNRKITRSSGSSTRVSYSDYYANKNNNTTVVGHNGGFSCKEIFFDSRAEAEEVLSGLDEVLDTYDGVASVADYYGLAGVSASPIDFKWGWTDLSNALTTNTRDGYLIKLPKPKPIK